MTSQNKISFEYKHKNAYRGSKNQKGRGNDKPPNDITIDYCLHWFDKICYSVLVRNVPRDDDVRKVQFFVENQKNWWSFQRVVDEQRKLLKATYESAVLIAGVIRLHSIHYYFDEDNVVTITVEYYTTKEDYGPSDKFIIRRLNEEIRKRYLGLLEEGSLDEEPLEVNESPEAQEESE